MTDPSPASQSSRRGFTLVEILIVVVILGILAMIVVPAFSSATNEARDSALRDSLSQFRRQVTLYQAQHNQMPGHPGGVLTTPASTDALEAQLTLFTDGTGNTAAAKDTTFKYGPYIDAMPKNPVNGLRTVRIDTGIATPVADGTTGWIYQPDNGQIHANLTTTDTKGQPFIGY